MYADISADTTKLQKGLQDGKSKLGSFKGSLNEVVQGVTGFSVAQLAGAGAVVALGNELKKAVTETVAYARQVENMSVATGMGVEETSKMIQVADDLKIEAGSLEVGFRNLVQKGVQPNIANIKELAEEYQSLPTPLAKSQFAIEKFGARAGPELQRLLEQTPEAIDAMADSAARAGLVLDEKAVDAAKRAEAAFDDLEDTWKGVEIQAGQGLIPVVDKGAKVLKFLISPTKDLNGAWRELMASLKKTPEVTDPTLRAFDALESELTKGITPAVVDLKRSMNELSLFMAGPLGEEFDQFSEKQGDLKDQAEEYRDELKKLGATEFMTPDQLAQMDTLRGKLIGVIMDMRELEKELKLEPDEITDNQAIIDLRLEAGKLEQQIIDLGGRPYLTDAQRDNIDELRTKLDEIKKKHKENADEHELATKRILFDLLQQQLAFVDLGDEAEFQLLQKVAKDWGLVDTETYDAYQQMSVYIQQLQDGEITADQFARMLRGIPAHVKTTVEIETIRYETKADPGGGNNPGTTVEARASGGPVTAGEPYLVGEEGPEVIVPPGNGTVIPNDKLGGATNIYYIFAKESPGEIGHALEIAELMGGASL